MEDFATIAVIGVLVFLVHAAFAVYLYRSLSGSATGSTGDSKREDPPGEPSGLPSGDRAGPSGAEAVRERSADVEAPREGTVQCPTCGTPNDPQFQFCRRCVSELSGGGPPRGGRGVTGT